MTVASALNRAPNRQSLPYVIGGLVVVGIAVFALWLLSGLTAMQGPAAADTSVQATVSAMASCQSATPNDTLTARVGGHPLTLKLNGCGNSVGTKLTVLLPAGAGANTMVDQTSAQPGTASGRSHRVAFLLLVVSAAAGGGFGYLLYRQRPEPADGARPAEDKNSHSRNTRRGREDDGEDDRSLSANEQLSSTNWFEDSSRLTSTPPPSTGNRPLIMSTGPDGAVRGRKANLSQDNWARPTT